VGARHHTFDLPTRYQTVARTQGMSCANLVLLNRTKEARRRAWALRTSVGHGRRRRRSTCRACALCPQDSRVQGKSRRQGPDRRVLMRDPVGPLETPARGVRNLECPLSDSRGWFRRAKRCRRAHFSRVRSRPTQPAVCAFLSLPWPIKAGRPRALRTGLKESDVRHHSAPSLHLVSRVTTCGRATRVAPRSVVLPDMWRCGHDTNSVGNGRARHRDALVERPRHRRRAPGEDVRDGIEPAASHRLQPRRGVESRRRGAAQSG
jgi:hypothetical protein